MGPNDTLACRSDGCHASYDPAPSLLLCLHRLLDPYCGLPEVNLKPQGGTGLLNLVIGNIATVDCGQDNVFKRMRHDWP